ncbi:hypothetical protein GCM10009624_15130 [Gordonia sinesedis]
MDDLVEWVAIVISIVSACVAGGILIHNRRVERTHVAKLDVKFIHTEQIPVQKAANLLLTNPSREPISVSAIRISVIGREPRYVFMHGVDALDPGGVQGAATEPPNPLASALLRVEHLDLPPGGTNVLALFGASVALEAASYGLPPSELCLELVTGHGAFEIPRNSAFQSTVMGMVATLHQLDVSNIPLNSMHPTAVRLLQSKIPDVLHNPNAYDLDAVRQWVRTLYPG